MNTVAETANLARSHGIVALPVKTNGSKRPDVPSWNPYKAAPPPKSTHDRWFRNAAGLGFVCGPVSGGLICLDFETDAALSEYAALVKELGHAELFARVAAGYLETAPSGGAHILVRCPERPDHPGEHLAAGGDGELLLETRGVGAEFVIAAPTGGQCHPSGRPYEMRLGGLDTIEDVTPDELDVLVSIGRMLDRTPPPEPREPSATTQAPNDELRPGEDFNVRGSWVEAFGDGWTHVTTRGDRRYWQRPGAHTPQSGNVATIDGVEVFYMQSTGCTDLPPGAYSKFGVYAHLHHRGAFKEAARALGKAGYGSSSQQRHANGPKWDPFSPVEEVDPARFFDKFGLVVPELGRHLLDLAPLRLGTDRRLWRYHAGVWRPDGDHHVRTQSARALGDKFKDRHTREVLAWLRAVEPTITDTPPARWINTPNGLVCWRTGELHPHDQDALSTVQIPVQWHPDATCPQTDTFLEQVLPADAIEFIWETIGYALYIGNPLHKAILLLGQGRNGKSVLLKIIRTLCGDHNTAAVPLQVLAENRFAGAELYGRLANICGDLDARAIKRSDLFKMLTGGDPLTVERKYHDPFTFVAWALPIFSANEPPISSDQTEAWFRRWLIVPFERVFSEEEADPQLGAKLTDQHELEGALVKAVDGLQRLMARGRFDTPPSVTAAGSRYREKLDTVAAFVTEECHLHPDAWERRSALYAAYRAWCGEQGRLAVSAQQFNDKLRALLGSRVEERKRSGNLGWVGIGHGPGATL